mmetsp:Transcript_1859/g.4707  ORF Transcript_1859/g.4707 Transcript_1859/m.4707 type:complete len:1484 (-) Transcript_1859:117-4568(-)
MTEDNDSVPRQISSGPRQSFNHGVRSPMMNGVLRPRRSVSAGVYDFPEEDEKGDLQLHLNHYWAVKQEKEKPDQAAVALTMTSQRFTFDVFANTVLAADKERRPGAENGHKGKKSFAIDPSSKIGLMMSLAEVGMLGYDMVVIPLEVADMGVSEDALPFELMKIFTVFFWTLDMILGFFTGYVDREGDFELRLRKIVRHYLKGRFFLDAAIVAIEWANFLISDQAIQDVFALPADSPSSVRMVRMFRISRLLKVRKMRHLMAGFLKRVRSNTLLALLGLYKVMLVTLLAIHWIACGWWMTHRNNDLYEDLQDIGTRYAQSLHWSLSQLGFGTTTVQPVTLGERLYASAVSLMYMCLFTYMLGSVVVGFNKLQALGESSEQEERLRQYLSTHKVSWPLKNRIWSFWEKYKKEQTMYMQESQVHLVAHLPSSLSAALRAEVFMPNMTQHPFFSTYAVSDCDKQAMHLLIQTKAIVEVSLGPEHELFTENTDASYMYFVAQGQIDYCMENAPQGTQGMPVIDDLASEIELDLNADTSSRIPIKDKDWLCEVALWLEWKHNGWAIGKVHSEILQLEQKAFGICFQPLKQAMRYSRKFLEYAKDNKWQINDAWCDRQKLRSIAQDVFEPMSIFDIMRCKPLPKDGRSEWEPSIGKWHTWHRLWSSPWRDHNLENRASLLNTMTTEMKNDCVLMYQTLFAVHSPEGQKAMDWLKLSKEDVELHDLRVLFLKRLILCLVICGLKFTTENNGRRHQHWHYPMASALCHGSRILVQLHNVPWRDFVAFLFFGGRHKTDTEEKWNWTHGAPPPLYSRRAATHCVRLDQDGYVTESRARNFGALHNHHYGLDLPIGGLGNPGPKCLKARNQLFIGPAGVPYYKMPLKRHYFNAIQHGHLYMRGDDLGDMTSRQLVRDRLQRHESERSWSSLSTFTNNNNNSNATASTAPEMRPTLQAPLVDDGSDVESLLPTPSNHQPREQRMLSGSMPAGHQAFNYRHYELVTNIHTEEDLRSVLVKYNHAELANDIDVVSMLFEVSVKGQELQIMLDAEKNLRICGWIINLCIELEEEEGANKVLVHKGASAARRRVRAQGTVQQLRDPAMMSDIDPMVSPFPPLGAARASNRRSVRASAFGMSSTFDPTMSMNSTMSVQSLHEMERIGMSKREAASFINEAERQAERRFIVDKRVLSMIWCRESMPWATVVSKYCTEVFDLSSEAVEKLIDGIYDPGQAGELYMSPEESPDTHCHHHRVACGVNDMTSEDHARSLPLEYTAVRMKTVIKKQDRHLFTDLLIEEQFVTTENDMPLSGWDGFGNLKGTTGYITRDWEWMDYSQAEEDRVTGMIRPRMEAYQLRLEEGHRQLNTLLLGIEASAPFKEDFFGESHNASGKSKEYSAFGKRKWRDYRRGGQEVPADLGGMHVFIDEGRFNYLRKIIDSLSLCKPSDRTVPEDEIADEKLNFQDILCDSLEGANKKVLAWWERNKASAMSAAASTSG